MSGGCQTGRASRRGLERGQRRLKVVQMFEKSSVHMALFDPARGGLQRGSRSRPKRSSGPLAMTTQIEELFSPTLAVSAEVRSVRTSDVHCSAAASAPRT